MRLALLAVTAFIAASDPAFAADPPIVFQTQPIGQMLDELRSAADMIAGPKGVKSLNKAIERKLGKQGFEGLDITRPIVGYVLLAAKPQETAAVIALPISGEKEFLELCERNNHQKAKPGSEKGTYELPPLVPGFKALLRFSNQYAYISFGNNPGPALAPAALAPPENLFVPTETGLIAGHIYFDRIPAAARPAIPKLLGHVKTNVLALLQFPENDPIVKAVLVEVDRLIARYAKLADGASEMTARINLDVATGDLVASASLAGKPQSELSANIAAIKPMTNKFAALLNAPDTVVGFKTRLPLFEPEIRAAARAGIKAGQAEAGVPPLPGLRDAVDELFKGLIRTVDTGKFDIVGAVRGPDKNGSFTAVGAVAFEDPSALEKAIRKFIENTIPGNEKDNFKWDAAKAGNVSIHTYAPTPGGFFDLTKGFGGADCTIAFAFAPHAIYGVIGPDAVNTMKAALAIAESESPMLEIVLNPARMVKLIGKMEPNDGRAQAEAEAALGKEDRLISAMSLTATGGKELAVTYRINLRLLPRAALIDDIEPQEAPPEAKP